MTGVPSDPRPFRLYGHRGAAAHHPENTLRSFRAAIDAGVDAIETDVRLCADGEVAVFHDADGQRTCGEPVAVRSCRWATVAGWDAGDGERPIRLSDLLEAFPTTFLNIDVKDADPAAAEAVVAAVRRAGAADRVGLGSFHRLTARAIRRAGWTGQLALTPREVAAVRLAGPAARWWVDGTAAQIPVAGGGFRLDGERFVARCHALGLRVDYWTIDDPDTALALVARGADGLVTNDPARIRAALTGRAAAAPPPGTPPGSPRR
ncbi:MAG: glycerophosphodiester phosphodiesterase family protein [Myxococcota bacterium]